MNVKELTDDTANQLGYDVVMVVGVNQITGESKAIHIAEIVLATLEVLKRSGYLDLAGPPSSAICPLCMEPIGDDEEKHDAPHDDDCTGIPCSCALEDIHASCCKNPQCKTNALEEVQR